MTGPHWALPPELRELADCGDAGIVQEVLTVFRSDTKERIAAMRSAWESADRNEVRKQAHALKGSSGQVGALPLSALCKTLESAALAAPTPEVGELLERIEREFQGVASLMAQVG